VATTAVAPTAVTPTAVTPTAVTTPAQPHTVALFDVRADGARLLVTVQVDGVTYDVTTGDTFLPGFTVDSIDGACARFSRDGRPFALCEGQAVVV
jgi:type IV pilus biogenesis protein PilP